MGRIGYQHTPEARRRISEAARRPRPRRPMIDRLWARVERDPKTGCLLWRGHVAKNGYGMMKIGRNPTRYESVHRIAYRIFYGEIPKDRPFVCHHCDVPICIEGSHLFAGTQGDNVRDCWEKGRGFTPGGAKGEEHPNSHLTASQVLDIRARYGSGERQTRLAEEYGIRQGHVSNLVLRKSWRHLGEQG